MLRMTLFIQHHVIIQMKKGSHHKIFSVALAILVLFSTFSFTVEKHYCAGTLVDVSIFSEAKTCCGKDIKNDGSKKTCCDDEVAIVEGQDELKLTLIEDVIFKKQHFVQASIYTNINDLQGVLKKPILHKNYVPPNIVYDIHILDQVFLI
ncbi:hypothetical protein MHTCC0001_25470 [Flavobacteriaceae bacterium MHTCC 0001]